MVKRCKVGDRAFIIKSDSPENIGKIVLVVDVGGWGDWIVKTEGSLLRVNTGYIHPNGKKFIIKTIRWAPDSETFDDRLMPIRGEPEKESEREKEVA